VYTHWRHIVQVLHCLSVAQNGHSVQLCLLLFINVCALHCSGLRIIQRTVFWFETFCVFWTRPPIPIIHTITVCLNTFHHFSYICHCLFPNQSSVIHPWLFSNKFYTYFNQISNTGCVLEPFLHDPNIKHCSCSHQSCILDPNILHSLILWRGESRAARALYRAGSAVASHTGSRSGSAGASHTVSRGGSAGASHTVSRGWVSQCLSYCVLCISSILIILIIIFIYCNWVVTRWQWLFYM